MTSRNPKDLLEKIEAELRRLGVFSGQIWPARTVRSAFGLSEMPFEDWLATVFLPRAYEVVESGRWPARSQVGVVAIRNFDGQDEYGRLIGLLCEFDRIAEACAVEPERARTLYPE